MPANYNALEQVVISGEVAGVERGMELAKLAGALRNLARARQALPEGPAMEGFHVEGPHISPEDGPRGAHPKRWVRPPDFEEFKRLQEAARGGIRLVTLSPEWPEAPRYIEELVRQGVTRMVEVGPGRVLSGLVRRIARGVEVLNVEDRASLEKTLPALKGA